MGTHSVPLLNEQQRSAAIALPSRYRYREPYASMVERLLMLSYRPDGCDCWLWLGERSGDGYGRLTVRTEGRRRVVQAHRVAYQVFVGPIPDGHDIDHRYACSRACIAPDHLHPRPWREHRLDALFRGTNPPKQLTLTL